jgi:release factor glutamine methyltransferase
MSRGVLQYEPELALFTQDASGTEFYEIFASCYQSRLKPGGKIFLEIGYGQGAKVAHLFEQSGWEKIKVSKDLAGHDRMVSAEKPQS